MATTANGHGRLGGKVALVTDHFELGGSENVSVPTLDVRVGLATR
jgi:hypothetical protein